MELKRQEVKLFSKSSRDVKKLYLSAFPAVERAPYLPLLLTAYRDLADFYAYYDGFSIKNENMDKVAELLMKIDSNYIYPYILLDYENAFVYSLYRPTISEESCNKDKVEQAFYAVGIQMERWADAILSVSLGLESPDDAIAKVKIDKKN